MTEIEIIWKALTGLAVAAVLYILNGFDKRMSGVEAKVEKIPEIYATKQELRDSVDRIERSTAQAVTRIERALELMGNRIEHLKDV